MTTTFVIAAVALAVAALGFVLRPLWRDNRAAGAGLFAATVVVAGLLYVLVGTPRALDPAERRGPETLADAITRLEAELQRNPEQPDGWRLLGRAQAAQGRYAEARDALAKAVQLAPDNPDLLVEAAEARALAAEGRRFDPSAIGLLRRALDQQPMHQRARWFLGIALRQAGQPAEAAAMWEPLLAAVDSPTATSLRTQINAARAEAGLAPLPTPSAEAPATVLQASVDLAPELRTRLGADDVLFVLARQPGSRMPLAVKRVPAKDFPIAIELGDGDSPMPTLKLSQVGEVELLARISPTGVADRAAGDLESAPLPARTRTTTKYRLRIDRVAE